MTELETRLTEIVEKEQGKEIVPFLQQLTQEERKSLIPCLNRLEGYYNKFVQLEERTYGTRATSEQHSILRVAALVIFPLKDFRKHEWGVDALQLNKIAAWHIPTWLNTHFKESEGKETGGFYNLDYEILMDWIERGILTVSPSPQTIAGYLVHYIHTTPVLQKRDITLKEHIWYLFEYDCGLNWHANPAKGYPYYTFQHFIEIGKLDRMRVLKESLLAINRNLNKNLSSWFAGMFTTLEPSIEEQLALQPEMFAVLSSLYSRPVNIILGLLKSLCSHPLFKTEEFLSQTSVLFASDVKAIHQNTIAILNKLAKERKEERDAICCAAAQGLMSREESIQSKIVKLIQTYGETGSASLKETLSTYAETMLTITRKELNAYLQNNASTLEETLPVSYKQSDTTSDFIAYEPVQPIIREDNRIQEITSVEDLIFLASQLLDTNELHHIDQFLGALVQQHPQMEAQQICQWTPVMQRAYKLILTGGSSRNGATDRTMAIFLIDYAKLLIRCFPEGAKELNALHEKMIRKDDIQKGQWGYCNLRELTIRKSSKYNADLPVYRLLLCRVLDLLENNKDRVALLSAPTHTPMFIDPLALIQRLKQYQQANVEPDDIDIQIALSRLALEHSSQDIPNILQELEGEYQNLLLFLLGEKEVAPQPPFNHPSWWMTAGLCKSSETVYPEFNDFPYSKGLREYLTGNFAWKTYLENESYTDYDGKVKEWTSPTLSLELTEGENVKIVFKGKYNEKIVYSTYSKHPLLVELIFQKEHHGEERIDLLRRIWLAPNTPEPVLAGCIRTAMYNPRLNEVREIMITQATMESLHQLRHTWHEISYLTEATCMLVADKTSRSYAAEIWIDRVSKGCIDSRRIGEILGSHQRTGWGPMKRLTDLIQQQMINVSPLHNRELETLLTSLLAQLPEKPVKELKKLLEIYAELLSINGSKVDDEHVLELLDTWKQTTSLKKVLASIKC